MATGADQFAPPTEPGVLSRVQTEALCETCGYNLRAAAVRRDGPTGLLVVRCPECGSFAPATCLSTNPHKWARRVCRAGVVWDSILVGLLLLEAGGLLHASWRALLSHHFGIPARQDIAAFASLLAAGGFVMQLAAMAIWKRHAALRVAILMLVPILAVAVLYGQPGPFFELPTYFPFVALAEIFAAGAMGLYARPIARALVRVLCPGSWRMIFERIWTIDGKMVPRGRQ